MILFNKVILTTFNQAGNAPFIDEAGTRIVIGRGIGYDPPVSVKADGYAIVWPWHLRLMRTRPRTLRTTRPVRALVVAVILSKEQRERRAEKRMRRVARCETATTPLKDEQYFAKDASPKEYAQRELRRRPPVIAATELPD